MTSPAEHAATVNEALGLYRSMILAGERQSTQSITAHDAAQASLTALRSEAERANELQQSIKTIVKEDGVVVIRLRNRAEAAETRANELEREVEQLNARWRQHMDFCPRPPA
jgi:hypothetical protein